MRKAFFTILILALVQTVAWTQQKKDKAALPDSDDSFEKEYQERIKKEYLFYPPIYIPKDLSDAFVQLNRKIDSESKHKYKTMPEDLVKEKMFYGLGRWIIHNWGFYGGSRFSHYLKQIGIHHPDDMAMFVMITYHRNLNKGKLDVKELVEAFKAKREEEKAARLNNGKVISTFKRKRKRPEEEN